MKELKEMYQDFINRKCLLHIVCKSKKEYYGYVNVVYPKGISIINDKKKIGAYIDFDAIAECKELDGSKSGYD